MSAETVRFYQERPSRDEAKQVYDLQQERLRRLSQQPTPTEVLGNLALVYLFGGAMAHGAFLPRTEVVTLEGAVATTEAADVLQKAA